MPQFIEAAPNNWKQRLLIPAVPKDGTPFNENFSLVLDSPVSYWGQLYTFVEPIEVAVDAFFTEGRIYTVISVTANASVPCLRCLKPAGVAITGNLRYLFSLGSNEDKKDETDGTADGDEELILLDSWEDEIDLTPLIWEVLITLLPAAVLCEEECKGLCIHCGQNLNISSCGCKNDNGDPRFNVLRSLVEDKNKE